MKPVHLMLRLAVVILLIAAVARIAHHQAGMWPSQWFLAILAAQVFNAISFFALGYRHAVLVRVPPVSYAIGLKASILAMGLNVILPARLSELVRATYVKARANVPIPAGITAIALERLLDLAAVASIAVAAGTLYVQLEPWLVGILALGPPVFVLLLPRMRRPFETLIHYLPFSRLRPFLLDTVEQLEHQSQRVFAPGILAATIIAWSAGVTSIYFPLAILSDGQLTLAQALGVFVATTLGGAVPSLPGGFGIYEGAAAGALHAAIGLPLVEGAMWGLVLHLAALTFPVLGTAWILISEHIDPRSLVPAHDRDTQSPRESVTR